MKTTESSRSAPSGFRRKIIDLDDRYGVFKAAKFGIAGASGFLLAEGILTLGVLRIYGQMDVPGGAYSSPTLLALNITALALGVCVAFFINEHFTVRDQRTSRDGGSNGAAMRLLKFEGVNAVGNAVAIGIELALLVTLSISPVLGNLAGAIVAYPITYLVSMRFVWKPAAGGQVAENRLQNRIQRQRKVGTPPPHIMTIIFVIALCALRLFLQRRRGID